MNFWGYLIKGLEDIFMIIFAPVMPTHESLGLVNAIYNGASSTLSLLMVVIFSNFAMAFPLIVFMVISTLEMTRFFISIIYKIKKFFL